MIFTIEAAKHLVVELVGRAEEVRVVLREAPDAGQALSSPDCSQR
jgi:hypothetical protein